MEIETISSRKEYLELLKQVTKHRSTILWIIATVAVLSLALLTNTRIVSVFSTYMPTIGPCFLILILVILAIPENRETEIGVPGISIGTLSLLLIIALLGLVIGFLSGSFYLSNLANFGFMFVIPILTLVYILKVDQTRLGLSAGSSVSRTWTIIIGVLYGVFVWFLIGMNELLEALLHYLPSSWYHYIVPAILLATVVILCAVAIPEEFLFRGVLQPAMTDRFGRVSGIMVSSLIFGLFHIPANYVMYINILPFWTDALFASVLMAFLFQTQVGLVLGVAYERTKSLLMPISLHAIHDIIELFPYFIYLIIGPVVIF